VKSSRLTITTTTITSREEEEQVGLITIYPFFSWVRIQMYPDPDKLKQEKERNPH
jgi:hypothetical protein